MNKLKRPFCRNAAFIESNSVKFSHSQTKSKETRDFDLDIASLKEKYGLIWHAKHQKELNYMLIYYKQLNLVEVEKR